MRRISSGPVFARYAVFRRTSALNFPHSCRSLSAISFFLTLCRLTNANSNTTWLVFFANPVRLRLLPIRRRGIGARCAVTLRASRRVYGRRWILRLRAE